VDEQRQWRVDVDKRVADKFAAELDAVGMSYREGTQRLMACWLAMEPDTRVLMLRLLSPERTGTLARAILRDMGRKPKG
jgi:hypothetical protein